MISWHTHLLGWGITYDRLSTMLAEINSKYPSFVPDKPAAYCRHLDPSQVLSKLLYMLKAPQKQYHVFRPKGFVVSRTTGEITEKPARIQKDWLRTGQRVRMCRLMADRYLDRLLFGQGEGTILCREIREEALRPFNQAQRSAAR